MTIWKFPLELTDSQFIENIPTDIEPLHLAIQGNQICLWVKVPSIRSSITRVEIRCFGTGVDISDNLEHLGTVVLPDMTVWHYFWDPKHVKSV